MEILRRAREGTFPAETGFTMHGLHSITKGEREVIRQLVHSVLVRDMSNFTPERFREWIKALDTSFRKVGLTVKPRIHDRNVHFTIKQMRGSTSGGGRVIFRFNSSTRVPFDDRDVAEIVPIIGNA
jgi:hypothetical protein